MFSRSRLFLVSALAVIAGFGIQCGDDAQVVARQVRDFISNVGSPDGQAQGALVQGAPPAASGGPSADVTIGSATVIVGGGSLATVSSDVPFGTILLAVGGAEDYYEINLPAPVAEAEIVVALSQTVPDSSFSFEYAVVGTNGAVGAFVGRPVSVQTVEAGDVQVSVSWGTAADVDLYVVDPSGESVNFTNRESASGGTLDLDANAGCSTTSVSAENISWPRGGAPSGAYEARVELFSGCDAASTKFVLTIQREGADPIVRVGNFDADGAEPLVVPFTYPVGGGEVPTTRCGDGTCNGGETLETCGEDCAVDTPTTCGNSQCDEEAGESSETCPEDCPRDAISVCGDELCAGTESCQTCAEDCGPCSEVCDVTGDWEGSLAIPVAAVEYTTSGSLVFDADALSDNLSGSFTAQLESCGAGEFCACFPEEASDSITGTLDGDQITFGYSSSDSFTFSGTVDASCSQMSGTITAQPPADAPALCLEAGGAAGTWTLVRPLVAP